MGNIFDGSAMYGTVSLQLVWGYRSSAVLFAAAVPLPSAYRGMEGGEGWRGSHDDSRLKHVSSRTLRCFVLFLSRTFHILRGLSMHPFLRSSSLPARFLGVSYRVIDAIAERCANRRVWLAASGVFSTGACAPSTTRCVVCDVSCGI